MNDKDRLAELPEWTEGVCGDGAAILRDGRPVTISEILTLLNQREALAAHEASRAEVSDAEIDFLQDWLMFIGNPMGQDCCGHGSIHGCCGNPVPVYATAEDISHAMNERLDELLAARNAGGSE